MGTLKLELLECVTQAGAWERGEQWPDDAYRKRLTRLYEQSVELGGTLKVPEVGINTAEPDSTQN